VHKRLRLFLLPAETPTPTPGHPTPCSDYHDREAERERQQHPQQQHPQQQHPQQQQQQEGGSPQQQHGNAALESPAPLQLAADPLLQGRRKRQRLNGEDLRARRQDAAAAMSRCEPQGG
jgi:hypothetical protein